MGRLICGLIFADSVPLGEIKEELEGSFCKISSESEIRAFSWTSYYRKEMGEGLKRKFLAFDCQVPQNALVDMKHRAISLEGKWSVAGKRRVNIDPGILTAERLVLATTKNFTHRIYLARGIFADLTLIYRKGGFLPLEWTYPDYSEAWALAFWGRVRRSYLAQLKTQKHDRIQGEDNA